MFYGFSPFFGWLYDYVGGYEDVCWTWCAFTIVVYVHCTSVLVVVVFNWLLMEILLLCQIR